LLYGILKVATLIARLLKNILHI